MFNIDDKEKQKAIALAGLDFLYLLLSLVLIHPDIYIDSQGARYTGGYAAAAIVYALGIFYPLLSKLIKGEAAKRKMSRVADIISFLGLIGLASTIAIYFVLEAENWFVWASYVSAVLSGAPSLFSLLIVAREYIISQ